MFSQEQQSWVTFPCTPWHSYGQSERVCWPIHCSSSGLSFILCFSVCVLERFNITIVFKHPLEHWMPCKAWVVSLHRAEIMFNFCLFLFYFCYFFILTENIAAWPLHSSCIGCHGWRRQQKISGWWSFFFLSSKRFVFVFLPAIPCSQNVTFRQTPYQ
jgi:hypothetical protein